MKKIHICIVLGILVACATAQSRELIIEASKDTFARSNDQNQNSGGSEYLLIAHLPSVISIAGFDLSSVTNEIRNASFSFRMHADAEVPVDALISPMVRTPGNMKWQEGTGALGVQGRNARVGEATFRQRSFPEQFWEAASGRDVVNLMARPLWDRPLGNISGVRWKQGEWVTLPIRDIALLEQVRTSDVPMLTLGIWGTSGNGLYRISSKESGYAPRLILEVVDPNK